MPPPSRTPSVAGRVAAAVLLSLGLHGLIVLGVWLAPVSLPHSTAAVDPTQVPEDYPALGLDDAPPPQPVPTPKRPDPEVKPASFDVKVVDAPPPSPGPAVAQAAPVVAGPGTAMPGATAGVGDGPGDGSPCALAVGKDAKTVVYVVDRSVSMGFHGALARARREVVASLRRLPPTAHFQVIAYNREAEPLSLAGRNGLLAADEDAVREAADAVSALKASGTTDQGQALRRALAFHPDVLYLLTDADDVSPDDVRTATRLNDRHTVIHAVEVSASASRPDGPLRKLAADNGGTYQRLDPDD